ncbi:phage tail protein [Paenibacillus taichungensis]|uniref:phage tail-collar fiber domain-containing protein n=1 Tax=Paenibacillus taichungensis TaxID=484184 RepID=UPI00382C1794
MSSWTYALTNKGRQLQAKAQTGVQLAYTRMSVGSGSLAGQSLEAMTALITPVKNLVIERLKHPTGSTRALIGGTLSNADVSTGFYFREIGIFATDPDDGEILYMYANSGSTADYIAPSGDGIIKKAVNMNVIVGTATNITAFIDESLVYVTRDEFEEALADIDVDIPDASLTVKGKVQLTNQITSQSQTLAATAKAVDDARTSAMAASLPRTGGALTGPLQISSWGDISASTGGYVLYGHNCYLDAAGVVYRYRSTHATMGARGIVFRLGAGLQGAWMFDTGVIGTTAGASFTPTLKRILNTDDLANAATDAATKANTAEANAKNYVDAKPWQKVAVTSDSGFALDISNANLNDPRNSGWYMGVNVINAPTTEWHFFEIIRHNELWEVQNAYNFNRTSFQQRLKQNGSWTPWTQDVFQSGVDAKNGIVGAINAKGGSASTNDNWATLANKVRAIETGVKYATGTLTSPIGQMLFLDRAGIGLYASPLTVTGLSFKPTRIIVRTVSFSGTSSVINVYDRSTELSVGNTGLYQLTYSNQGSALSDVRLVRVFEYASMPTEGANVNSNSFRLPVGSGNVEYKWEAFGV